MEAIQKKRFFFPSMPLKDDLPISQPNGKETHLIGLRRRISSFSVKIQPLSSAWALQRSKSMPSLSEFTGGPLRRWWDASFGWLLSRKPSFVKDLEMNEEESAMLGWQSKASWLHVFYKVRSGFRRLIGSDHSLPVKQGFRYDSFSYAQNFDDGKRIESFEEN